MPKLPERGSLTFDPPLYRNSELYNRAWELMKEMDVSRTTVFSIKGPGNIHGLCFETKEQAMLFRLRL